MNEFTFIEANLLSSLVSRAGRQAAAQAAGSVPGHGEARVPGQGTWVCSPSAGTSASPHPGGTPHPSGLV